MYVHNIYNVKSNNIYIQRYKNISSKLTLNQTVACALLHIFRHLGGVILRAPFASDLFGYRGCDGENFPKFRGASKNDATPSCFFTPQSPLKGDIPNKYPLYKVYMGLMIKVQETSNQIYTITLMTYVCFFWKNIKLSHVLIFLLNIPMIPWLTHMALPAAPSLRMTGTSKIFSWPRGKWVSRNASRMTFERNFQYFFVFDPPRKKLIRLWYCKLKGSNGSIIDECFAILAVHFAGVNGGLKI